MFAKCGGAGVLACVSACTRDWRRRAPLPRAAFAFLPRQPGHRRRGDCAVLPWPEGTHRADSDHDIVVLMPELSARVEALQLLRAARRVEGECAGALWNARMQVEATRARVVSASAEVEGCPISEPERLARASVSGRKLGRPKGSLGESRIDGKEDERGRFLGLGVSKSVPAKIAGVSEPTPHHFIGTRGLRLGSWDSASQHPICAISLP